MTESYPDWLYELLKDPEQNDSEWGRSCHFCGSTHGSYDKPLEHYIDCVWVEATRAIASDLTDQLPPGHAIFEPIPCAPCEKCGWHYDSPDDWRGREMPPPSDEATQQAHTLHRCEDHGITLEEYDAGPNGEASASGYSIFVHDGRLAWEMKWMNEEMWQRFTFNVERGAITYLASPDLSDEAIRSPDA